jgi:hypothetical protein
MLTNWRFWPDSTCKMKPRKRSAIASSTFRHEINRHCSILSSVYITKANLNYQNEKHSTFFFNFIVSLSSFFCKNNSTLFFAYFNYFKKKKRFFFVVMLGSPLTFFHSDSLPVCSQQLFSFFLFRSID